MDRNLIANFLQDEINVQLYNYNEIVNTNCDNLLFKGEYLFRGKIIKISSNEIYVKFKAQNGIPRINSGAYICYTLLKSDRSKDTIKNLSFKDLINRAQFSFEFKPSVYFVDHEDKNFIIGIFTNFEIEVPQIISSYNNSIVYIGITPPPLEMLANLKHFVLSDKSNNILDYEYATINEIKTEPIKEPITDFILEKINLDYSPIIQGPPGSGKSFLIAELVRQFCQSNKSVLVISLTNQALIEIAKKDQLAKLLALHRVQKSSLRTSDLNQVKELQPLTEVTPVYGHLHLATCYKASFAIIANCPKKYDYVLIDEASECTLPMLSMAIALGNKFAIFGDLCQLPPVVELNDDIINKRNYNNVVYGLNSISYIYKTYQLLQTYRLPKLSAVCTSHFYKYPVATKSNFKEILNINIEKISLTMNLGTFIFFIKMDDSKEPVEAIDLACKITQHLYQKDNTTNIAILSYLKIIMKAIHKRIINSKMNSNNNIIVETVHRIQGLTTDYSIFVHPNYMNHKVFSNLINVATSRGRKGNFIIMDRASLDVIKFKYSGTNINNFFNCILEQHMYIDL